MALKKSEKNLLMILGVVVLVFFINQFVCGSGDKKNSANQVTKNDPPPSLASAIKSKMNKPVTPKKVTTIPKNQYDSWGRDPFSGITTSRTRTSSSKTSKSKKSISKFKLNGIFYEKGKKSYVMINKEILGVGDEKWGLKVVRIDEKQVLCSQGGRTFTLYWKE
jgi:hypothetical protein